jgi:hypothetical protein
MVVPAIEEELVAVVAFHRMVGVAIVAVVPYHTAAVATEEELLFAVAYHRAAAVAIEEALHVATFH